MERSDLFSRVAAYFEIIRPWYIPILLPVIVAPAFMAYRGVPPFYETILAMLTFIFIKSGVSAVNDYFDVSVDLLIHPKRPIPSGRIKPTHGMFFGAFLMLVGILIAELVNLAFFSIAFFGVVFYVIHCWKIKKIHSIPGIATIGTNFSMSLIALGGWASAAALEPMAIYIMLITFFWDAAHDTTSAIRDIEGDKAHKLYSFAVAFGSSKAAKIALFLFCIVFAMSLGLGFLVNLGVLYYAAIFIIGFVTFYYLHCLIKNPTSESAVKSHKVLSIFILILFVMVIFGIV